MQHGRSIGQFFVVLGCAVWLGCGSGGTQGSAHQRSRAAAKREPLRCDRGQVLEVDHCVAVVNPEQIAAVRSQADRLGAMDEMLAMVSVLEAPVTLLNAFRELPAWKTAAALNKQLRAADEIVVALDASIADVKALRSTLGNSRAKLTDLVGLLQGIQDGSAIGTTLADVKVEVSGLVSSIVGPLDEQLKILVGNTVRPAREQLDKLATMQQIVCGIIALRGGDEVAQTLCKTGGVAIQKAQAVLVKLETLPAGMLGDIVGDLDVQLDVFIDDEPAASKAP